MKWFRLYDSVLDDPKVQRLPAELFKAWINLMCLANKGEPRGTLPPTVEEVAFRLRISDEECARVLDELRSRELLELADDGELLQPHNWQERQPVSDNVTPRVYKSREAKKAALSNAECNVTSNVAVTAQEEKREEERKKKRRGEETHAIAALAAPPEAANGTNVAHLNQQLWAALRDSLGYEPHAENKQERGGWNGAIKSLRNIGETPETIPELVALYRQRWPGIDCSPQALVNRHSLIRSAPPAKANGTNGHGSRAVDKSAVKGSAKEMADQFRAKQAAEMGAG